MRALDERTPLMQIQGSTLDQTYMYASSQFRLKGPVMYASVLIEVRADDCNFELYRYQYL